MRPYFVFFCGHTEHRVRTAGRRQTTAGVGRRQVALGFAYVAGRSDEDGGCLGPLHSCTTGLWLLGSTSV